MRDSCTDTIGDLGDLPDMVENYMDYSDQDCQNSFTIGQSAIMASVVQNERIGLTTSIGLTNCNTSVGINELAQFTSVYPVPSTENITIENTSQLLDEINVYNSMGQLISSVRPTDSKTTFNLSQKGVYILKIKRGENTLVRKVVIQ